MGKKYIRDYVMGAPDVNSVLEFRANELRKIYDVIGRYLEWEKGNSIEKSFTEYLTSEVNNYYDLDPTDFPIRFSNVNKGIQFIRDNVFNKEYMFSGIVLRKIAYQKLIGWNAVPMCLDELLSRIFLFILDNNEEYRNLKKELREILLADFTRYYKQLNDKDADKKIACIKKSLVFIFDFLFSKKTVNAQKLFSSLCEMKEYDYFVAKM